MSARHTPAPCYCCEPCREEAVRAAAPDLLAALREFLRVMDALGERNVLSGWPVVSEALAPCRAAIAKAEGR